MESRPLPDDADPPRDDDARVDDEPPEEPAAPQFRLIVRKLELPVRPRGVLAE